MKREYMLTVCPELVREWNYERNKILPEDYREVARKSGGYVNRDMNGEQQ